MMRDDFAVFILSYKRADNVITLKTLKRMKYDGKWFIVVGNDDDTIDEYIKIYGKEHVIVFDKEAVAKTFDVGDNFGKRKTVVFARNACFEIAQSLGLKYFLELDDDYSAFMFRYIDDGQLKSVMCKDVTKPMNAMLRFLDVSGAFTVAFAQGGDYLGGVDGGFFHKGLARKAMNTFFCRTDKPFKFVGTINEDVNTYVTMGMRGELLFTYTRFSINQKATQTNSGGMTGIYLDNGTYLKSFYSVMYCPSAVTIREMGEKHRRLHHHINWAKCVPKIINERYRRGVDDGTQ